MSMTGAELKTRLEGLGLPPSWFADKVGVTMRTVVRWFDGDDVSEDVEELVDELSSLTVQEMQKMVDRAASEGEVILLTYRTDKEFKSQWPAAWHRSLTFRVLDHFRAQDRPVRVEYR